MLQYPPVHVPIPGTVLYVWRLTHELTPAGQAGQFDGLADAISWCRFRADWVARTGRWPLTDALMPPGDRLGLELARARNRVEDAPGLIALQRDGERVLRCCRLAVWWWSTDPLRWLVATTLLHQGWLGGELDLLRTVDGIAAAQRRDPS